MNYKAAVAANLKHMGTEGGEWSALPSLGFVEVEAGSTTRMLPEFDYSSIEGYTQAPTLFPSGTSADSGCCELCSHPIKIAYPLANHSRKWRMIVGSECVTHFSEDGKSGVRLSKEAQWEANRDLLRQAIAVRREMWEVFTEEGYRWQNGHNVKCRVWPRHMTTMQKAYEELKKLTQDMHPDKESDWKYAPYTENAQITRWVNKHGARLNELFASIEERLAHRKAA